MKTRQESEAVEFGQTVERYWYEPDGVPKGGLVMVHGLGDYLERYEHVAKLFTGLGFLCVGIDLPGHGHSSGQRGHIPAFEMIGDLLDHQVMLLTGKLPDQAPLGMFAHSMGGFAALDYLPRRPKVFQFAWISSPLIEPGVNHPPLLKALAGVLGAILPRLSLDTKVRRDQLSHANPKTGEHSRDPLKHHQISASLGAELMEKGSQLHKVTRGFDPDLQLLMTHGSEDPVCSPELSRKLFDSLDITRKVYLAVEGALHEPLHDDRADWLLEWVGRWLAEMGYR